MALEILVADGFLSDGKDGRLKVVYTREVNRLSFYLNDEMIFIAHWYGGIANLFFRACQLWLSTDDLRQE